MKTLSLKLDDAIFEEAEELTAQMHVARNRYINEAVKRYSSFNKRRLLKSQLVRESGLTKDESIKKLLEFDALMDGMQPI